MSSSQTPSRTILRDYTSGPVSRQLISFAWPFMISNLLQMAYNLVDMAVVGQYVGAAGLSAVSIGADLHHLFLFWGMGLSNAGQIIISQYVGLKDRDSLSRITGTMITLLMCLSVAVAVLALLVKNTALRLLHVPPEALVYCSQYTVCLILGLPLMYGYLMISAMLRGLGDSRRPMVFIAIASIVNILLDIVFVRNGMGPFGAALATVIAQGLSFAISVVYLWRNRDKLGFDFQIRHLIPDRKNALLLVKLGIPMMLQNSAISISTLFISSKINTFGVIVAAVTGVGAKLSAVASIITMAFSQSGSTMVGQNFAARKFDRVGKALLTSLVINVVFAALLSAVIILDPEGVFALFNKEEAVLAMCRTYVPIAVLNFFAWALRGPSMSLCNGMGYPIMNFTLGMIDGVVMRIGLCLLMGDVLGMGIQGYWLSSALAGYTFFLIMFPYFLSGRWKRRAPPVGSEA